MKEYLLYIPMENNVTGYVKWMELTMTVSCNYQINNISNSNPIKDDTLLDSVVGEVFDLINASNYFSNLIGVGGVISIVAIVEHIVSSVIYFIIERNLIKKYIYNIYENFLFFIEKVGLAKNSPHKKNIKN